MSKETLEQYQTKSAKLNYLLQLFQYYVIMKKEFELQQRLEAEIKKLAEAELPETKPTLELA